MKMKVRNPFRLSFLAVSVVCCVVLSIVFYYITYTNNKAAQEVYAQEKAEASMEELERQLDMLRDIALKIVSDYEFRPDYFKGKLSREKAMLEKLSYYKYYNILTEEYFLDYGEDRIYLSSGNTSDLNLFIQKYSKDREQQKTFKEELVRSREKLTEIVGKPSMFTAFGKICVLIPFRAGGAEWKKSAVLGFIIENGTLEERFRLAGGKMKGVMTLYKQEEVIYSSHEGICSSEQRGVVTVVSEDGGYTLCCRLETEYNTQGSLFFMQLLLVICDACLVVVIANIFAEKTYKPIRILAEDYGKKVGVKREDSENALEELRYMMDRLLQSNMESNLQIQEDQKILRAQILKMLLDGNISWELQSYMEKVQIYLPGPLYCVVSISFEGEEKATPDFLQELNGQLERIVDVNEKNHIYTICNPENRLINAICSIQSEEEKEEFIEMVCDVAQSFIYEPIIGIGNAYSVLRNLSASWLESMDTIESKKKRKGQDFIYDDKQLLFSKLKVA